MSDTDRIEQRVAAVERAVVDGDAELDDLADVASVAADLEALTARLEAHERRIADLEGRLDALDGFVGSVESVNDDVERRADIAIAAVDRLERRLGELERAVDPADVDELALASPRGDERMADGRTDVSETNESATARGDCESTDPSTRPTSIAATDSAGEPPTVERTVSDIVSPAGDSETDPPRDILERRLSESAAAGAVDTESADTDAVESEPVGRDGSIDSTRSSETAVALDETCDRAHDTDGDESTAGVLQSLRARLP